MPDMIVCFLAVFSVVQDCQFKGDFEQRYTKGPIHRKGFFFFFFFLTCSKFSVDFWLISKKIDIWKS